ncbi:MAG TPA: NAD-dependent epimerase/dehydratase family protein, partial [Vicinamibacteria bacterium]|nr:NAD-dependent epimerase/dehydratase family protein [Vicinamibacteria bacterium]
MTSIVTGAAGFVGSVLVRRLHGDGREVHALVRPKSDLWRLEGLDLPIHAVDLADAGPVSDLVARLRPKRIFHLAAHGAYPA